MLGEVNYMFKVTKLLRHLIASHGPTICLVRRLLGH